METWDGDRGGDEDGVVIGAWVIGDAWTKTWDRGRHGGGVVTGAWMLETWDLDMGPRRDTESSLALVVI